MGYSLCQCGNVKATESKQCKECYEIWRELVYWEGCGNVPSYHQPLKVEDPRLVCPECGGKKDVRAKVCQKCRVPNHESIYDKCSCGRRKWKKHEYCGKCNAQLRAKEYKSESKRHPWLVAGERTYNRWQSKGGRSEL